MIELGKPRTRLVTESQLSGKAAFRPPAGAVIVDGDGRNLWRRGGTVMLSSSELDNSFLPEGP